MAGTAPDNKYIDHVVELAQKGALFLFDLGYFKVQSLARIAAAGAYFLSRLNHQTTIFALHAGHLQPLDLAGFLNTLLEALSHAGGLHELLG